MKQIHTTIRDYFKNGKYLCSFTMKDEIREPIEGFCHVDPDSKSYKETTRMNIILRDPKTGKFLSWKKVAKSNEYYDMSEIKPC